mmetsp:Transcript_13045/g.40187  ORF Transcript_13045/g.40187 Transcript_13045/m.40187 type:complete len:195 (+) Transcript_13045:576-1160(+)
MQRLKRGRKKVVENRVCAECGTERTTQWRFDDNNLYCNACGMRRIRASSAGRGKISAGKAQSTTESDATDTAKDRGESSTRRRSLEKAVDTSTFPGPSAGDDEPLPSISKLFSKEEALTFELDEPLPPAGFFLQERTRLSEAPRAPEFPEPVKKQRVSLPSMSELLSSCQREDSDREEAGQSEPGGSQLPRRPQ